MYYNIEKEFKKNSYYKKDLVFVLILLLSYIMLAIIIGSLLNSVWYSYGLIPLIIPVQYTYIYHITKKNFNFPVKYWDLKRNVQIYMNERKSRDTKLLIKVCEKNGINSRPKVLEAIRHYQVLVPRNIIGSGMFLSLIAVIISVVAFSFNENNVISSERFQLIMALFLLATILYALFKFTINQITSSFGRKALYRKMEDILSLIYFQSLIK
jgi:hypothetical protein